METKEYTTVDKTTWIRGEWDNEPDKIQWPDQATGLPCLIVRGPSGALCGYVGVPDGHRFYKKDYDAIQDRIEVHGGITFANMCADSADESKHICHVPGLGEPDHVWWFGFDCAHSGDLCPSYARDRGGFGGYDYYKNVSYVKHQVQRLAAQLAGHETGDSNA